MNVLALDTSNYSLGIALVNEDKVIGEYMTNLKKNHSVRVMPGIEKLLGDCDMKPADLGKIVVAKGPGFTRRANWCNDRKNISLDIEYSIGWGFEFGSASGRSRKAF